MKHSSLLALILSLLFLVFVLLLVFLRIPFPLYPLMSWQDALDLLTPLLLIPVYWLLLRSAVAERASPAAEITFIALAALWVLGQGMHLAANSINNLIGSLASAQLPPDLPRLVNFYDEYLSHFVWHLGIFGLAGLLIVRAWPYASAEPTRWSLVAPAAFLHGISLFLAVDEGNTVAVGLPFMAAVVLAVLLTGRGKLASRPIIAFFFGSFLVATLVFIGWGLYFGGFPPVMAALGL